MKRITLIVLLLASVCFAGVLTQPDQQTIWLKNDMTWTNDTACIVDTLTCTGTLKYSSPFLMPGGFATLFAKCAYSSAAADTDTVQINLYKASRNTTNALRWILVDSCLWGGRADTLYKSNTFNVSGSYGVWWRFGFKKRMGVPKLIDKSRNSQ
jgi:hypothetical protein